MRKRVAKHQFQNQATLDLNQVYLQVMAQAEQSTAQDVLDLLATQSYVGGRYTQGVCIAREENRRMGMQSKCWKQVKREYAGRSN